jgi:hypothetical protein
MQNVELSTKKSPYTGQDKTTQPTHPSTVEEPHDKRKRESRQDNRQVVPILPHNQRIFPQRLFILFFTIGRLGKQPSAMAIPKSLGCIVGIFFSVATRMMPNMIGAPSQRRVFKRPPARDEKTGLHPRFAFEASMGDQTMIAHGNPEPGDQIQHDEHSPIERRKPIEIPKQRYADDGRNRHGEKEHNRWIVCFEVRLLHSYPPVTMIWG